MEIHGELVSVPLRFIGVRFRTLRSHVCVGLFSRETEKVLADSLYTHSSPDEELAMMPKVCENASRSIEPPADQCLSAPQELYDLQTKVFQKMNALQIKMKEVTKVC